MTVIKSVITQLANGHSLTRQATYQVFDLMMTGEASSAQIASILTALRVRGETIEEITGAAEILREKMTRVKAPANALDIVGTGGDASSSYNISTAAAIVAAAAGLKIAKHGNRALSSRSGAADVLQALGVKIDLPPEKISECIEEANVGFMFAPSHHSAMKYVGPTRAELGFRTIFNMVGPLANPAGVKRQVTGVFSKAWLQPFAQVLNNLGCEACWICHGFGGLDEIVPTGPSWIAQLKHGHITEFEITPEQVDISRSHPAELTGGDAGQNAKAFEGVLAGHPSAFRDAVVMTTAAALLVGEAVTHYGAGVKLAQLTIDNGQAALTLAKLVEVSNH